MDNFRDLDIAIGVLKEYLACANMVEDGTKKHPCMINGDSKKEVLLSLTNAISILEGAKPGKVITVNLTDTISTADK